ncbi:hypothetical protein P691DRAFT_782750 [Macrolepiota fuliginosa MF-IS2]|uniref:Uncharacterized protein n=1 Tax=Macrolepiota fuliginosa MF-IS2 TaxID=1400762 RepID=A0A9P5WXS4_9AGAR|nr:hypothetical protein P691DRAFT_782750 [Macrolepiota fuliginosa MF-IS2]
MAHDEASPFWVALPQPASFMDCQQKTQGLMGLSPLPADAPDYVPVGKALLASMYQAPPKDQAKLQRRRERERRAPVARAIVSQPAPKPLVKPLVPRAPARLRASSSRVTLEESEEEEDLSS